MRDCICGFVETLTADKILCLLQSQVYNFGWGLKSQTHTNRERERERKRELARRAIDENRIIIGRFALHSFYIVLCCVTTMQLRCGIFFSSFQFMCVIKCTRPKSTALYPTTLLSYPYLSILFFWIFPDNSTSSTFFPNDLLRKCTPCNERA